MNRWLTRWTDGFIACARGHAQHLVVTEGFPADRVFMIPNGVDTERFHPDEAMRGWLRAELGIDSASPIVGIVAALREEKNHGQFIEAARMVLRHSPDVNFVIVGDGPERPRIEAQVLDSGLGNNFHLMGTRSDTPKILAGMDVFCLTSRNEANPVSILEALACGIPVVSPDVGSIRETVLDGVSGVLTEPCDAQSTSDALIRLLGNPSYAKGMGLAGRESICSDWSLEAMVRGYEFLLQTLYNSKSPTCVILPQSRDTSRTCQNGNTDGSLEQQHSDPIPVFDTRCAEFSNISSLNGSR